MTDDATKSVSVEDVLTDEDRKDLDEARDDSDDEKDDDGD